MGFLNRLSIVQKISIIPGIALLSFGVYLALTASIAKSNSALLHEARDVQFPVLRLSDRLLFSLDKISELFSSAVTTADEEPLAAATQTYQQLREDLQEVSELAPSASIQAKNIDSLLQEYHSLAERLSRSMISGTADYAKLGAESARMNAAFTQLKDAASSFQAEKLLEFQESFDTANRSAERMVGLGLLVGVLAFALLLLATIPLVLGIKRNLGQVVNSLRSIAEENGDLTVRLTAASRDEVGDLVFWFNSFMDKLQNVIKSVVEVSQPMGALAEQLNSVAEGANDSIAAQRKSTNSASDAIESMSDSIAAVADNAAHAASAASQGRERARGGQLTVEQTVESIKGLAANVSHIHKVIHQLEEDSRRVGSVLDVIRSIADQTNLLALNAAIEAARAGEQGRGFAVVADEVRTLASKTQHSTAEIQETIERFQKAAKNAVGIMADSTSQAEVSVDNANNAGSSLQAIHDSIIDIDRLNESIANATHGQSRATQEIVTIISGIRERSDQTADSSAKLRDVSTQLVALARQMSAVNQKFKV